ncbi:hypothetical protein GMMP1_970006 [Candidatus Magnetomoraceae bacterium gMMP-1]
MPKNWDEIFVGRKSYVEQLLNTKSNFFIFGARRIGKTSLLKFVEKNFPNKTSGFYISIQGCYDSEKIKRKIRNSFRRQPMKFEDSLFTDFSFFEFLDELDIKLTKLKRNFVFLIDEAEQIAEIEKKEPGFVDKFRNRLDELKNIRFVLTASPYFIKIVIKSECSAFLSGFTNSLLTPMTSDEITELMQEIMPKIQAYEIEKIMFFTHCQPYLVRIFMNKLLKNDRLQNPTEEIAVDTYISNALDGIYENYFDGLSSKNQEIIHKIHANKFKFDNKYKHQLREICQYGYLKCENKIWKISNWFFNHWLDRDSGKVEEKNKIPKPKQNENIKSENSEPSEKKYQFIYSLCGLGLGMFCIVGGIYLFVSGVAGETQMNLKCLGISGKISNAAPGSVLFLVGLFIIFITKFRKGKKINSNNVQKKGG